MTVAICPVGLEYERLRFGIRWLIRHDPPVEKIYLLVDKRSPDDPIGGPFAKVSNENKAALEHAIKTDEIVPGEIHTVEERFNPIDYHDVLSCVRRVLETERTAARVWVDITAATKEAIAAIMLVSCLYDNVQLYMIPGQERQEPFPEDVFSRILAVRKKVPGRGFQPIYLPPRERLKPGEIAILAKLAQMGGKCSSEVRLAKKCLCSRPKIVRIVRSLEARNLVQTKRVQQQKIIELTEYGKVIAKIIEACEPKSCATRNLK